MDQGLIKHTVTLQRGLIGAILLILGGAIEFVLVRPASDQPSLGVIAPQANLLALAPAAFLAGVLSFLSPCTLPILPAYFAWTFGTADDTLAPAHRRSKVLLSSLSFFAGLATTMVIVGASFTAIGQLVGSNRTLFAQVGGVVIIGFGLMSMVGKGFSGPQVTQSRRATLTGAYLYGLTFALGWTACIGPVLGAILTLLLTQGASLLSGAVLSFVYVLGLGGPLILVATFFSRLGQGSRAWRVLRGRGWEFHLAGRTLFVHSTSVISGLLMVGIGALLVSGALSSLSQYATFGTGEWGLNLEEQLTRLFDLW